MDLIAKTRDFFGKPVEFRHEQLSVLRAILDRVTPILVVAPTGSGKSLLFQLPAKLGSLGVSIVIEPLVSLLQDQHRRARTLGISSAIFDARNPPDSARLVFTTPETFVSKDFRNFVNRLRITQLLDRVFIDEVHVILSTKNTFRRSLSRLGDVVDLRTQIVLLTATLPPRYERDLLRTLYLASYEPKIFRSPSERPNIRYSVRFPKTKEEVFSIIRGLDNKYSPGRLIIYARTREEVRGYSKTLGLASYYSNSPGKDRVLSDFLEGKIRVIVATSSLGLGIDLPNIRAVIHLGLPYTLYDYAQETGRAGRDNLASEAILLLSSPKTPGLGRQPTTSETFEKDVIQRYISPTCRRAIFNSYLDGEEEKKCDSSSIPCDFCQPDYSGKFETSFKRFF